MQAGTDTAQESRTERGTLMLTREEKQGAILVAAFLGKSESDIYRDFTIGQVCEEAARIRGLRSQGA